MQTKPGFVSKQAHLSLQKDYDKLAQINNEQQQKITFLEQELAQLKRMVFGSKRERFVLENTGQLPLELEGIKKPEEPPEKEQLSYERKKSKKQGKAVRLELPHHLPRQTETIEPDELQEGAKRIGESVTEILEYNPGKLFVKKYVRPKYVQLKEDELSESKIVIGDLPTLPIPQGNAGPGLLAHLLISKYVDHLPFYRKANNLKEKASK